MAVPTILIEDAQAVRTITLDRPGKLNAFDGAMAKGLFAALEGARSEAIRAVVLTGAGKAFSAGQDLADVLPKPDAPPIDLGNVLETRWNPIVRAIRSLGKPVICAVNGTAAGAAANIALACESSWRRARRSSSSRSASWVSCPTAAAHGCCRA